MSLTALAARPLGTQATDGFPVTPHDTNLLSVDAANIHKYELANLYSGSGGSIKVTTADGTALTFTNVPAGTFLPIVVKQVFVTGTTATNIIALTGRFDYPPVMSK